MLRFVAFVLPIVALDQLCLAVSRGPHHPRGPHRHHTPQAGSDPMQDSQILHDTVHIEEDLAKVVANPDVDKMSPSELEFHYFKLHDADNNTKLDGLEILEAIRHTLHEEEEEIEGEIDQTKKTLEHFVDFIDRVLEEDDLDRDGYISYVEYAVAREKEKRREEEASEGR